MKSWYLANKDDDGEVEEDGSEVEAVLVFW